MEDSCHSILIVVFVSLVLNSVVHMEKLCEENKIL